MAILDVGRRRIDLQSATPARDPASEAVEGGDPYPAWTVEIEPLSGDPPFDDPIDRSGSAFGVRQLSDDVYASAFVEAVEPHAPALAVRLNSIATGDVVPVEALRRSGDVEDLRAARAEEFARVRDERDEIAAEVEALNDWLGDLDVDRAVEFLDHDQSAEDAYFAENSTTFHVEEWRDLVEACHQLWLCEALDEATRRHGDEAAIRVW